MAFNVDVTFNRTCVSRLGCCNQIRMLPSRHFSF